MSKKNEIKSGDSRPNIPSIPNERAVYLKSPLSMNNFTAGAKCIMDELRERHKQIEKRGASNVHPSELLLLDKIEESLNRFSNLSIQAKSTQGIDQALKQLTDSEGNQQNRSIYIYPFLLKNNNKVNAKVALIAPQNAPEVNIRPYRDACFNLSKPVIDLILQNRSKRIKEIDDTNPGNFLIQLNKNGHNWLYPLNCSIEAEVGILIKKAFKPYNPIPIRDFITDFIEYAKEKKSVTMIASDYHMIRDELQLNPDGTYQNQPEIIIHYRAQADGLEKFILEYFPKIIAEALQLEGAKEKLTNFKKTVVDTAPPERKQNREKIRQMIAFIREFPFNRVNTELCRRVEETCNNSTRILEALLAQMDQLIERKNQTLIDITVKNLINNVYTITKREQTLIPLNIRAELEKTDIKDNEQMVKMEYSIKDQLKSQLGCYEGLNIFGEETFYAVDQGYMASVLHKLTTISSTDPEYEKQIEYAKIINQNMINTKNPRLNVNIKDEHLDNLYVDMKKIELIDGDKKKSEDFHKKYNTIAGLLGGLVTLLLFFSISFMYTDLILILIGFPVALVVAYLAALFFRQKEKEPKFKERKNTTTAKTKAVVESNSQKQDSNTEEDLGPKIDSVSKEDKINQIAKISENYIFPKKYDSIGEKIFDQSTLKKKIQEQVDTIKNHIPLLSKETDLDKIASSIEYALITNSIVIAIPPDIIPKNKPAQIIISKNDFKSPLMRGQMAEYYRELAEKSKFDASLVKYYTFLINTIEVEYHKFLSKKR